MKITRFFVTAVLFVTTAGLMACDAYHSANKSTQPSASAQTAQQVETIRADNAKLEQAAALQADLEQSYQIVLRDTRDARGEVVKGTTRAEDFEWLTLTKARRSDVKEKLAKFVALMGEVLEIDARKGVYVTNTDRVIGARDAAVGYQKELETFEKIRGVNFEPKVGSESLPAYKKSHSI